MLKESFTTKFGQVIHPGDKVAVATLASKRVRTYTGTYIGYAGEDSHKRAQILIAWPYTKNKTAINTLWDNNIFLLESKNANL